MSENITIKGLDQLQKKFNGLADFKDGLKKTTDKATKFVWGEIPPYPSASPASSYRRTGTLGRTMYSEVRELSDEVVGVIGNNTAYAPWVISATEINNRGPQAGFHSGRWYTLQGVVEKARNGIIQIYEDWIKGLIE